MPHRQVTRGTWGESRGQRCTFHIPGLLRVWRPDSHHDSRDQPRASPCPRRRSPWRNGERYDLDDSYGRDNFRPAPRGGPTCEAESPLARPLLFDSWERLRHSLPFEEEGPYSRASVPRARSDVQPRYEVREPAWARQQEQEEEEEQQRRERYPGTASGFADMGPRFYRRRPYRAIGYEDNGYQHERHFAGPASRASEHPCSHTANRSGYEGCSGQQGRSFDYDVPPPAPDPPSYSPVTARYDDARPWQPHVHVGGHAERSRYYRRDGVDDGFEHDHGHEF
jgi:hypothetical protein